MATNDFVPVAPGPIANVPTQSAYLADPAVTTGYQSGVAKSAFVNKSLRQGTTMAAVVAQMIVDYTGQNAVDDGTTATLLANLKAALKGRLLNIQVFQTAGTFTYTPTAGTTSVIADALGGGGGGGGTGPSGAGLSTASGGGGGGARGITNRITSGFSGVSVVVGAGGIGVLNANGSAGGTSSFGGFVSAPGGAGAVATNGQATPGFGQFGGGGGVPTGTAVQTAVPGLQGGNAAIYTTAVVLSGKGGDSVYGSGGITLGTSATGVSVNGSNGSGFGSGGSGGCSTASAANSKGGNGTSGLVIVYEYY